MLKIIDELQPFFEDNYQKIHVREYAKIKNISPPTASKILEKFQKDNLLKKEIDKRYFYFYANRESFVLRDLQRVYYRTKLNGLIDYIKSETVNPTIILFGSLVKVEAKKTSDIDITIFVPSKKQLNIEKFEKQLNRKIQLFIFKNINSIPNELKNNILNGYILEGEL